MLKNDEEPARSEGGEEEPCKETFPDKAAGDTLESTFIFPVSSSFLKTHAPLSFPPPFFPNSLELFLQTFVSLKDRQQLQAKEQKGLTMRKETDRETPLPYRTR